MGNILASSPASPAPATLSELFETLFRKTKPCRVLLLGLDNAGKTTILYRLKKFGENDAADCPIAVMPTVGFNVETFTYKNLEFTAWDAAGDVRLRPAWRNYIHNIDALVYVVDSSDKARINEATEELHRLFECPQLHAASLLVYANKQDRDDALSPEKVQELLRLDAITTNPYHVQPSTADSGEGLLEGLLWLTKAMPAPAS